MIYLSKVNAMEDVIKRIQDYSLEEIMGDRFGKYSKYIIQDRAIPHVRDSVKRLFDILVWKSFFYQSWDYNIYDSILCSLWLDNFKSSLWYKSKINYNRIYKWNIKKIDKLGKTTANKSREVFNFVFHIVRDGILTVSSVESAKIYKRGKSNIKILTKKEIKEFLLTTWSSETWYLEILLALFCGLRKIKV